MDSGGILTPSSRSKISENMSREDSPDHLPRRHFGNSIKLSIWFRSWKTTTLILAFYLTALICAIGHHAFFTYLHGRVVNNGKEIPSFPSTSIAQSYDTTISLVLITVFCASLIASLGLSYTQYLWQTFRSQTLAVEAIEDLLHIRSNAMRLLNFSLVRFTPALFIIAVISWLLPVALIYPPAALVVALQDHHTLETFNVSIIPQDPNRDGRKVWTYDEGDNMTSSNTGCGFAQGSYDCGYIFGIQDAVLTVAKGIQLDRKIVDLEHPSSADYSYNLTFQGPRLQCRQTNGTRLATLHASDFETQYMGFWQAESPDRTSDAQRQSSAFKTSCPTSRLSSKSGEIELELLQGLLYDIRVEATCPLKSGHDNARNFIYEMANETSFVFYTTTTRCVAATAEYHVNIRVSKGQQLISYSTKNEELLLGPVTPPETRNIQPLRSQQEFSDVLALIDALVSIFGPTEGEQGKSFYFEEANMSPREVTLPSGATIQVCPVMFEQGPRNNNNGTSILGLSAFNGLPKKYEANLFLYTLNLSESLLNEVLANITISVLSLNVYRDLVNGTSTRTLNTYKFQHKLSFYLPYGLSIIFTCPIIVVGLLALRRNGVSAIDGGFLQILMTTTGDTRLRELATTACISGEENIPEELKKLKVRFGELMVGESSQMNKFTTSEIASQGDEAISIGASDENDATQLNASQETQTTPSATLQDPNQHSIPDQTQSDGGDENNQEIVSEVQSLTHASLASARSIHTPLIEPVRRTGFGTLDETKSLLSGTRYI